MAYTGLLITESNCSKLATTKTASPANSTAVEHIKILSTQALSLKNKLLETIKNSSIITNFTSDNLFHKLLFVLSLKPCILTPGFMTRAEWIVVPSIFTADMPI